MKQFKSLSLGHYLTARIICMLVVTIIAMAPIQQSYAVSNDVGDNVSNYVFAETIISAVKHVVFLQETTVIEEPVITASMVEKTVAFNEGSNVILSEDDLNLRFHLGNDFLNHYDGVYQWMSSDMGWIKETYYACSLSEVFRLFSKEIGYDYSNVRQRSDGVWCIATGTSEQDWLVCVAANLSVYPRGSLVRTSLGYGIVCDTGTFIYEEQGSRWFDIAVSSNHWGGTKRVFNQE